MIDNGPVKGARNHIACMLVAFWRQRGRSEQEAWDMLIEWNNGSLPERELQTLFRSTSKVIMFMVVTRLKPMRLVLLHAEKTVNSTRVINHHD